ncbi:MAG: CRISPR-associated protein Cas5 [Nitrospinae bacterium]|nr:CRISPR-associated protein Cas5 [Nitrospinota bacterium]
MFSIISGLVITRFSLQPSYSSPPKSAAVGLLC